MCAEDDQPAGPACRSTQSNEPDTAEDLAELIHGYIQS